MKAAGDVIVASSMSSIHPRQLLDSDECDAIGMRPLSPIERLNEMDLHALEIERSRAFGWAI